MTTHLQKSKEVLFGENGLRASNFKLFPGNARDASAERVAQEINESIARIEEGQFEALETFAD